MSKFKLTSRIYWSGNPDYHSTCCKVCEYEFVDQQFVVVIEYSFYKIFTCSPLCADTYVLQHMEDLEIAAFDKFVFPMIRAVYPNLIANQLVNVQPMTSVNESWKKCFENE